MIRRAGLAGTLALLLAATTAAAVDPVDFFASIEPALTEVEPDDLFEVTFSAGDPAEHFNGYEVVLQFDPAVLEFVSAAEGSLMIQAAPFRWTVPQSTDSTVTFTHVLLAAGAFVDGPGPLSTYTFRAVANGASPIAIVSDPHCTFVDAGLCVNADSGQTFPRAVQMTDGLVVVGGGTSAPESGRLRPGFAPNPTRGGGELTFSAARAFDRVRLVDVSGREILGEELAPGVRGSGVWTWDGLGPDRRRVPPGVYWAILEGGSGPAATKVVVLR
ncbi:MAG: cohesin domain-containing protein [bacterium]